MKLFVYCLLSFALTQTGMAQEAMSQQKMEAIIKALAADAQGQGGFVSFSYNDVSMYLISDQANNRMRIITPIIEYSKIPEAMLHDILEANFHNTLDARYAVSKGKLFAAFIHPLKELSPSQLKSAVIQVSNLSLNFGRSYSSGALQYNGKGLKQRSI